MNFNVYMIYDMYVCEIYIYIALLYIIHNKYDFFDNIISPVLVDPGRSPIPSTHYFKYIIASQHEIVATNYCTLTL